MGSATEVRLGDRSFRPEELSALVLKSLKEDIERTYGQTVTDAVISVPPTSATANARPRASPVNWRG